VSRHYKLKAEIFDWGKKGESNGGIELLPLSQEISFKGIEARDNTRELSTSNEVMQNLGTTFSEIIGAYRNTEDTQTLIEIRRVILREEWGAPWDEVKFHKKKKILARICTIGGSNWDGREGNKKVEGENAL